MSRLRRRIQGEGKSEIQERIRRDVFPPFDLTAGKRTMFLTAERVNFRAGIFCIKRYSKQVCLEYTPFYKLMVKIL